MEKKVYDATNSQNKNLITHFVWHLEKEKRYGIDTLSTDRVSNKKYFYGKILENVHQNFVPDAFFNFGE